MAKENNRQLTETNNNHENDTLRQILVSTGAQRITDVDRFYFKVLDILIKRVLNAALPPDVGVHYGCEFDATFAYAQLENASNHFVFFKCVQKPPLRAELLVKYVNVEKLAAKLAGEVIESIKKEISLLALLQERGATTARAAVVQCYFACARTEKVYYLFFERPSETLEELLRRRSVEEIKYNAKVVPRSQQQRKRLTLREACFIMKTIASVLAALHHAGIVHGSLCTNSVFVFKANQSRTTPATGPPPRFEDQMSLKLGNFYFAHVFDHSQANNSSVRSEEVFLEELVKGRELNTLFSVADRVKAATRFKTPITEAKYIEAAAVLMTKEVSSESVIVISEGKVTRWRTQLSPSAADITTSGTTTNSVEKVEIVAPPEQRLNSFIASMVSLYK